MSWADPHGTMLRLASRMFVFGIVLVESARVMTKDIFEYKDPDNGYPDNGHPKKEEI